jgi:RNA polymerase sigma-70 factor (ECF subfamily)
VKIWVRKSTQTSTHCGEDAPADLATSLFERYQRPVLRYCLSGLRSREEAEDAVQMTFLRAFAALRRGVQPDFEAAWLFKIAHNVCLSQRAGAARRGQLESARDMATLEQTIAAPEACGDELIHLDDALAEMPPRLRRALLLREWQGLSYAEIADALEISHAAVETLIFRARRHLARALDDGFDPAAPRRPLAAAAA